MAVVLTVAEKSQQAVIAFHSRSRCVAENLRTLVSGGSDSGDVSPAMVDANALQVRIRQIEISFDKVCALAGMAFFASPGCPYPPPITTSRPSNGVCGC